MRFMYPFTFTKFNIQSSILYTFALTELLLYANLPCHNNKVVISLNLIKEKSLANAAYLPSFPSIPTPI